MKENRLVNFDFMRIVALFAIIVGTFVAPALKIAEITSFDWDLLNVFMTLSRFGFPLLLMLSGAFMLDENAEPDVRGILKNYVLRLSVVFAVWSFVYALLGEIFTIGEGSFFRRFLTGSDHLWFVLAIIGLYLITPMLRAFVRIADKTLLEYTLLLSFLFAFLLPYFAWFMEWHALTEMLDLLKIRAIGGYLGYYLAGYYLTRHTPDRSKRILIYVLSIIALFTTAFLTQANSEFHGVAVDQFYHLLSPAIAIWSVAVFLLLYHLKFGIVSPATERVFYNLSAVSFAAFIVHDFFFRLIGAIGITAASLTPFITVPLFCGLVFCISLLVGLVLKRIPFLGKYLG